MMHAPAMTRTAAVARLAALVLFLALPLLWLGVYGLFLLRRCHRVLTSQAIKLSNSGARPGCLSSLHPQQRATPDSSNPTPGLADSAADTR